MWDYTEEEFYKIADSLLENGAKVSVEQLLILNCFA